LNKRFFLGGAVMAASLVVVMCFVAACGGSTVGKRTSGAPQRGGDVVVARTEDGRTLDPVRAVTPADIAPINQIFGQLFRMSADGKTLEPSLAESASNSVDGRIWTIRLRPGVQFSDGSPVTAHDVKFSLDRSRNSQSAFAFLLSAISDVAVRDDHTVTITTAEPSGTLIAALGSWLGSILPADLRGLPDEKFFESPIGSGPFKLDSWDRGRSIRLVRNDGYWERDRPFLDSVEWTVVPDPNTRVAQVQGGMADIAEDIPPSQVDSLTTADIEAATFPTDTSTFLIFNQTFAPFADVNVRRAIAQAVNREALTEATLFGSAVPACSMLPPTMPFSAMPRCLGYDLEAARRELAQSAWPQGFDVELLVDNLPTSSTAAQIIQAQLEPLGIHAKIKTVDSGQIYTTFDQGAYQMGLALWASDIADPDEQLTFMLDPSAGSNSYYTGFDDPKIIALLAQGRSTLDPKARALAYNQIQQIAADQLPQLPLWHQDAPYVWSQRIAPFSVNPMRMIDFTNLGKES
jgi:peptide/nickel transport system substrate-binding protein